MGQKPGKTGRDDRGKQYRILGLNRARTCEQRVGNPDKTAFVRGKEVAEIRRPCCPEHCVLFAIEKVLSYPPPYSFPFTFTILLRKKDKIFGQASSCALA